MWRAPVSSSAFVREDETIGRWARGGPSPLAASARAEAARAELSPRFAGELPGEVPMTGLVSSAPPPSHRCHRKGLGRAPWLRALLFCAALIAVLGSPSRAMAADADTDGVDDAIDNCPIDYNPGQKDRDGNAIGDACDDGD